MGVSVGGGGQYVEVAAFCGCFQSVATCFGGKRFRLLSGGFASSQVLCLALVGSTRFSSE